MNRRRADRGLRRLLDSAGLALVVAWPVACVVAVVALWLADV